MLNRLLTVMALMPCFIIVPKATAVRADTKPARVRAVSWAGPAYQGAGNRPATLTALDHTAIQMLYGQSNIGFDSGAERGYAFARTFTPDGVLVAQGGTPITGHDQLAAVAAKNTSCMQTWLTNLMIEPSPEGAIGWAYIWQVDLACGSRPAVADAGAAGAVKEGGLYRDVIVKAAEGWKFKRRSYTPGHTISKAEKPPVLQPAATEPAPARASALTALDYAEIKQVVGRYNLGWDSTGRVDNGALVGKSFTSDAIFHSPGPQPWLGSVGIAAEAAKTRSGINHWVSNLLIAPTPDGGAVSWCSLLLTNVTESGRPVTLAGGGILHEAYAKTPEGWRIKYRRYEPVGTTATINWPKPEERHFVPAADPKAQAGTGKLTSADYIAIEQLYIMNNIALDSGAEEGQQFARTFTADGVIVSEDNRSRTEGKMLAQLPRTVLKEPALHTWMTNLTVEPSREGAVGRADMLNATLVPRTAGSNARHTITGARRYTDELVKTPDGWRFKKRTYKAHAAAP